MDNYFDYIVIIFFVVTAIASLLKKKKKALEEDSGDVQTGQRQADITEAEEIPIQTTGARPMLAEKQRGMDPFGDTAMFGNRNRNEPNYAQEKKSSTFQEFKSEVDNYFEAALKKSMEVEKTTLQPAAKPQPKRSPKPEPQPDVASHSTFIGKAIEYDNTKPGKVSNRADNIRKKIRNTTELREFIVISEILNKPKALRK